MAKRRRQPNVEVHEADTECETLSLASRIATTDASAALPAHRCRCGVIFYVPSNYEKHVQVADH